MYFSNTLSLFPMNRFFSLYVKATNMNREFTVEKEPICAVQWWHWRPQCGVYVISQKSQQGHLVLPDFSISSDSYEHILQASDLGEKFFKRSKKQSFKPFRVKILLPVQVHMRQIRLLCWTFPSHRDSPKWNILSCLVPELVHPRIPGQQEVFLKYTFQTS